MNVTQLMLYVLGGTLMVVGLVLLFFEAGLADWIPVGVALAGVIILIGVLVVGLSENARTRTIEVRREKERPAERERIEHHYHEGGPRP